METLLTPVKTSTHAKHYQDLLVPAGSVAQKEIVPALETVDDAIIILKSKPSLEALQSTLGWLECCFSRDDASNINVPSSKSAQIIFILVHDIVPSYWSVLCDARRSSQIKVKYSLIRCLSTINGIGIIANRINLLLGDRQAQSQPTKPANGEELADLSSLLSRILEKSTFVYDVLRNLRSFVSSSSKRSLIWKEALSLLAAGRILALAAQAEVVMKRTSSTGKEENWLATGSQYAAWLGNNIEHMIRRLKVDDEEGWKAASQMLSKALTLGYIDNITIATFSSPLAGDGRNLGVYRQALDGLNLNEKRNILHSMLRIASKRLQGFNKECSDVEETDDDTKILQGVAALISGLTADDDELKECMCQWLTGNNAAGLGQGIAIQRAVIAALAVDQEQLKKVFEKALALFNDKLYIKHTPILQQEVNSQILLIVAGYLHRGYDGYLRLQSRSSTYINGISNRLSASSPRACLLGMLVGTAISELVDAEGKRMKFSAEEIDTADGRWYRSLVTIQDSVGSVEDLKSDNHQPKKFSTARTHSSSKHSEDSWTRKEPSSKIIAIEEVYDQTESEDEDFVTYEKPDSDVSDEDEDPTLVQRDRPTAPVYIRDLVAGLRDTENYDRHKLALSHASDLIRRKANFGSEVSGHIEELATLLVGLGDKYNMEDFQQMRLRGMIAVLIAQPLKMGQWFSRTFFNGDYSMGQRASVLTTLGLGARELAGLPDEDASIIAAATASRNNFPSKLLPEKLHKIYAAEAKPVDAISAQLEKAMIKPMAVDAAEELAGPSALKIRTFSSRMSVEKKRERPIANSLAKIVAEGFLFPLMGLWRTHAQAYGDQTVHASPFLLTLYLKTLSLILHASGSSTLSLPQMTAEFWDLLLSLRGHAADLPVLEALLFAFLTLLDINGSNQARLAEEHAKELLETQEWVQMVFAQVGGGSEEGERARMLAAGVLTRTREVVEKHQRMLMGALTNYM